MKPMVASSLGRLEIKSGRYSVKQASWFVAVAMMLIFASCSSSKKADGENPDEAPPAESASTDAVPQDSAEKKGDQKADGTASPSSSTATSSQSSPTTDSASSNSTSNSSLSSGSSESSGGSSGSSGGSTAPDPGSSSGTSGSSASAPPPGNDAAGSSGTAASTPPPSDSGSGAAMGGSAGAGAGAESYSVRGGDSLMKIAFDTYGDIYQWRKIWDMNRDAIKDPNRIPVGTVLRVERPASPINVSGNGEKYLIRKGDTLGSIAQEVYGSKSKWRKLYENNRQLIRDPNKIFAGFFLYYLPDSESPTQKKPTPLASKILENAEKKAASANGGGTRAPASVGGGPAKTGNSAGKK